MTFDSSQIFSLLKRAAMLCKPEICSCLDLLFMFTSKNSVHLNHFNPQPFNTQPLDELFPRIPHKKPEESLEC